MSYTPKNSKNGLRHHTFVDVSDAILAAKSGQFWEGDIVSVSGINFIVDADFSLEPIMNQSDNTIGKN